MVFKLLYQGTVGFVKVKDQRQVVHATTEYQVPEEGRRKEEMKGKGRRGKRKEGGGRGKEGGGKGYYKASTEYRSF